MAYTSFKGECSYQMPLRIVLVGFQSAGKSSAASTILGSQGLESKKRLECVVKQGLVFGQQLTVVEAPGWLFGQAEDSTEILKQEIMCSLAPCSPGPHAVLIVIPVNISFSEAHRTSVVKHLDLLGTNVWHYTLVLFTAGDYLGDRTVEQHIEREGNSIQWLLEKCGHRYHVFNNKNTSDNDQVSDLLQKIQEMVAENDYSHYHTDLHVSEAEKQKKKAMERACERKSEVQKKRKKIREKIGCIKNTSELRLVLMEHRPHQNISAANFILGKEESALNRSAECVKSQEEVDSRQVTLVQVPHWCRSRQITESSQLLQQEIILSASLCPPGPHAIVLTVRTDLAFKESDRSVIEQHLKLLGEKVWNHTIVLFTCGNFLGETPIELHIESEGDALQWLVEKCGNRYHVFKTKCKNPAVQIQDLLRKVDETVAENNHCYYEMEKDILKVAKERKRKANERADQRKQKVKDQRIYIRSQIGDRKLSEFRLVLLMGEADKGLAGNIILGCEAFKLESAFQSEVKQHIVAGRKVTVVNSPYWSDLNLQNAAKMYKSDCLYSLYLCNPGPHALLIVIPIESRYSEMNSRAMEDHLMLFNQTVWNHTLVLFTHEDWLGQTPIELHIESEGSALQWLLEKCGNRYHVFNTKVKNNTQVMQLFEKIEEIVQENKQCYFQLDQSVIMAVNERKDEEKRAKQREMKAQKIREERQASIVRKLHISSLETEAVQEPHRSMWVPSGGRVSPAPSYMSLKSDLSMPPPLNFSLRPTPNLPSECLTLVDLSKYPMYSELPMDPVSFNRCDSGQQCAKIQSPCASKEASNKIHDVTFDSTTDLTDSGELLCINNTTDDSKRDMTY